jgi:hypothetical protein
VSKRNDLPFEITLDVRAASFCLHLGRAARALTRPLGRSAKRT